MSHVARLSPNSALKLVSPAIATIADVAALLATGDDLDRVVPSVLGIVADALGATEASLWRSDAGDLSRAYTLGETSVTAADVRQRLDANSLVGDGLALARLSTGTRSLGAIVVAMTREIGTEEFVLLTTIGTMLAPALVHAEYSRQLETEVALRTQQIEQQRRFTERIIDSMPVGLYVIDREFRIQAWNRKRETGMQGVSREEAIGRTIFEILHRQPAELLRQEFEDVFSTGRIAEFQMESAASGEHRTYRITKIPMRVDDTTVTHVITIGEDITEWREAQQRFAQAEKLAAIGTLAAGVMHEINNPLATIAACGESLQIGLKEMADSGVEPPKGTGDYLSIIDQEVHRCKRIVNGLLEFSRPRAVGKEMVDLNEVIEKTLFLLKHHASFKKMSIELDLDRQAQPIVDGNAEQLIQVFMALLLNATDAMQEQGRVKLRTRGAKKKNDLVVAEVTDDGHGIKRPDMQKLFEPFFTTKPPGRGTGLGLSICYGIIAEHGGRIEVDSAVGQGATFRISLPRVTT
ncbi:MAG TPA: ATP-binding protein [Gemmatimonadaceae bacterium]|nr:ATP-binding protein [Gemmatimonadaceae bacterium]